MPAPKMQIRRELGRYVRAVRNSLSMTRDELAARLGISPKTLKQAELGIYALGGRPWGIVQGLAGKLTDLPALSREALEHANSVRDVASRIMSHEPPATTAKTYVNMWSDDDFTAAIKLALDKDTVARATAAAKIAGVEVEVILKAMLQRR